MSSVIHNAIFLSLSYIVYAAAIVTGMSFLCRISLGVAACIFVDLGNVCQGEFFHDTSFV